MRKILTCINNKKFVYNRKDILKSIENYKKDYKNAMAYLKENDLQYIDAEVFDLEVFLREYLTMYSDTSEYLFNRTTGILSFEPLVIEYVGTMLRFTSYSKEKKKEIKKHLSEALKVMQAEKAIKGLEIITSTGKSDIIEVNPMLVCEPTIISRNKKIEYYEEYTHKNRVDYVKSDSERVEVNILNRYLSYLCEKCGLDYEKYSKDNKGIFTDLSLELETKYVPLLLNGHIYSKRLKELKKEMETEKLNTMPFINIVHNDLLNEVVEAATMFNAEVFYVDNYKVIYC